MISSFRQDLVLYASSYIQRDPSFAQLLSLSFLAHLFALGFPLTLPCRSGANMLLLSRWYVRILPSAHPHHSHPSSNQICASLDLQLLNARDDLLRLLPVLSLKLVPLPTALSPHVELESPRPARELYALD